MKHLLALLPFCFSTLAIADTTENNWECQVHDSTNMHWVGKGSYERAATNKAFEACKKESKVPETCRAAKENCDVFVNGKSTRPMWRCTALDQYAKTWRSRIYPHRDDAALAAKAYCQENSGMPDSCYIHLMTCVNLNERQ